MELWYETVKRLCCRQLRRTVPVLAQLVRMLLCVQHPAPSQLPVLLPTGCLSALQLPGCCLNLNLPIQPGIASRVACQQGGGGGDVCTVQHVLSQNRKPTAGS